MSRLPPYLLPVLQMKVQGYPNQTIADQLGYPVLTVQKYVQRTIQFFKDKGLWDPQLSARTGLLACGKHYLDMLAASALRDEFDITTIYPNRAVSSKVGNGSAYTLSWRDMPPNQIEAEFRKITADPFEIGSRTILLANRLYRDRLCTEAIPIFGLAENLLGSTTNLAAKAACSTAQMYIEIGDLDNAQAKITAAQRLYEAIADPEIRIEMQHINGWINYSQGNLHQAEAWYRESLQVAAATGADHLAKHAHHFLGCIYRDWGSASLDRLTADEWFHRADLHLDAAYKIHLTWGEDGDKGYDLFRKAQLRQLQRQCSEAKQLRAQARQLFGADVHNLSVDLEETQIILQDRHEDKALYHAEKLLESWTDLKGTRGIADALRLMGDTQRLRGKVEQALQLYVAALCMYPYPNCPNNRKIWQNIPMLLGQIDDKTKQKQVNQLVEQIEERQGPFVYLNNVTVDRRADIAQIIHKLTGSF